MPESKGWANQVGVCLLGSPRRRAIVPAEFFSIQCLRGMYVLTALSCAYANACSSRAVLSPTCLRPRYLGFRSIAADLGRRLWAGSGV